MPSKVERATIDEGRWVGADQGSANDQMGREGKTGLCTYMNYMNTIIVESIHENL